MPLFGNTDLFHIPNPDPEWHYFWCLESPPNRLIEFLQFGYELVVGKEQIEKLFGAGSAEFVTTPTGRVRKGDCVLLRFPMARYQKEVVEPEDQATKDQWDRVAEGFHAAVDRIGVRGVTSYQTTTEEYTDSKAHATRESVNRVGYTGPAKR